MAIANILIDGSSPPKLDATIGYTATLTNSDNTGVTSWLWEIIDKPLTSSATLTTPTLSSSTISTDKEGTYLLRLTVNGSITHTAAVAVVSALSGIRYPAAYEQTEANSARGWATDLNAIIRNFELSTKVGPTVAAMASETITTGDPVSIYGSSVLVDGTPVPSIRVANAASADRLPAIGVAINSGGVGTKIYVRSYGYCTENSYSISATVGSPMYVQDDGSIGPTSGTNSFVIGYVVYSHVSSGKIFISPGVSASAGTASYWAADSDFIYNTNVSSVGIGDVPVGDATLEVFGSTKTKNIMLFATDANDTFIGGQLSPYSNHVYVRGYVGDQSQPGGALTVESGIGGETSGVSGGGSGGTLYLRGGAGGVGDGVTFGSGAGGDVVLIPGLEGTGFTSSRDAANIIFRPVDSLSGGARSKVYIDAKDYSDDGYWILTQNPADDNYDVGYLRGSTGFLIRVGYDDGGGYTTANLIASYGAKIIAPPYGEPSTVQETLYVDTNQGLVGVRCAAYYHLDVNGNARIRDTNKLYFGGTGIGDADVNLYRNAANVLKTDDTFIASTIGVGTSSPAIALEVASVGTDDSQIFATGYKGGGALPSPGIIGRGARGTLLAPEALWANDLLAVFGGRGYNGSAFTTGSSGYIAIRASQNWNSGANGAYMVFGTTSDGSTSSVERMRIHPDGRIGVGTGSTAPWAKLDILDPQTNVWNTGTINTPNFRVWNLNSGGVSGNYSSVVFQVSTDNGTNNSFAQIACVQDRAASTGSALSFVLRRDYNAGYFEALKISAAGKFTFTTPAVSGGNESLLKAVVAGSGNDAMYWTNGTSLDGTYLPQFSGICDTRNDRYSIGFLGFTSAANDASDSSAFGLVDFNALRTSTPSDPIAGSLTSPVNRKLFTWRNAASGADADIKMVMYADGSLEVDKSDHTLYVDAANNRVGVGTNTPVAKLEVVGSSYPVYRGIRTTSDTNIMRAAVSAQHRTTSDMSDGFGAAFIFEGRDTAGVDNYFADIAGFRDGADTNGGLSLATYISNSRQVRVVIKNDGSTGIGDITPYFKLDIDGDLRIRGTNKLYIGGTGSGDADVNLYRSAANVLKTDDDLIANHFNLTTAEYDDLTFPLLSSATGTLNAPTIMRIMDATGTGTVQGVFGYGFADNREDSLLFTAQLPHSYKEGTDIEFHIHWTMVTATTGTVRWGLEYAWANKDGTFNVVVPANAATTRQRSGTTARLTFTSAHGLVVGQNIVVAGAAVADYNVNAVVTAMSDTSTYWVEYTIASGTEGVTTDSGVNVVGYTIQIAATETLSTNSQWKHLVTSVGTIVGVNKGTNKAVSSILLCRVYRPELGGHIAERVPAITADFHYQKDTIGSRSLYTKV